MPPGWPGRVVIGGTGLAHGYWRNDELTHKRFRPFPFLSLPRAYDSGDVGILDRQLGFEILGRTDTQIKVVGQRVETEEIELCIRQLDRVSDAAVCVFETYLLAWVCERSATVSIGASTSAFESRIRDHLICHLPSVMVPTKIFRVASLPQLSSGKLDRQAIMDWARTAIESDVSTTSGAGSAEQLVADVWSSVLGRPLGAGDSDCRRTFFQLGGTSAGVIQAFDRLARRYPSLALADLFAHTTLPGLAAFLERQAAPGTGPMQSYGRERLRATGRLSRMRPPKETHP